ncbi:MAG: hypothetical protein ABSG04_08940, partial [Verrucomicrobiota bacterium]
RSWFSRLTNSSGVDDARTIVDEANTLQHALRENRRTIIPQLLRTRGDGQATLIFAAWEYSLETMIQAAASKKICSWKVQGIEESGDDDRGEGDITLRRA